MDPNRSFQDAPLPLFPSPGPGTAADEVPQARGAPPAGGARLPSYISDHRARLRDRFMQGGAGAMPDYELLELVLFRAIPRQDVKPLARLLIDRFGDFNRVLSAPAPRLAEVPGVGPAVVQELKIVEAAAQRYWKTSAADLGPQRAARLMAVLPAPRDRSPVSGTSFIARRGASIQKGAETVRQDGRAACFLP